MLTDEIRRELVNEAVASLRRMGGAPEAIVAGWQFAATPTIWGLPVIVHPDCPEDTFYVMSFADAEEATSGSTPPHQPQ